MQLVQVQSYGFLPVVGGHSSPSQMAVSVRGRVSPVRRRLFDSDPEGDAQELDNRRTVERQMDQLQREKTAKWNFDFKNEVPLSTGRYVWQPATLPDFRPSHPLPPLTGIKRPIDNQQLDSAIAAPLFKQMKHDSINNNHRSVNQTKITGKYLRKSFPICVWVCVLLPRAKFRSSRVYSLSVCEKGVELKAIVRWRLYREKSSRSPRSRLVLFRKKRGGKKYEFIFPEEKRVNFPPRFLSFKKKKTLESIRQKYFVF